MAGAFPVLTSLEPMTQGNNPSDSSRSPMQNADLQQGKHGPKFLKLPQAIRQMISESPC